MSESSLGCAFSLKYRLSMVRYRSDYVFLASERVEVVFQYLVCLAVYGNALKPSNKHADVYSQTTYCTSILIR
jgi:hypothetical protein